LARPHTGEQHHGIEASGEQAFGKVEGLAIVRHGDFPHRRRNEGFSALFCDQLLHLGGAPAFQRQYAFSTESHVGIIDKHPSKGRYCENPHIPLVSYRLLTSYQTDFLENIAT
jgi:hypothetical protein